MPIARDDRALVPVGVRRLRRRKEPGPQQNAVGAEHESRRDPRAVGNASGDNHRDLGNGADHHPREWQRRHHPDVPSAFGPLRNDGVRAGLGRARGLTDRVGLMHVHCATRVRTLCERAQVIFGARPSGRDHARACRDDSVDLIFVDREQQEVQAERTAGACADGLDGGTDLLRVHRAHSQRTEAARFAHGGNEIRPRRAGHAAEHDRMADAEQLSESCLDHRRPSGAKR